MKNDVRLLYSLNRMSPEEAKRFGIGETERRRYLRMDDAKTNLKPPEEARWFQLIGVPIGNATEMYPRGDNVPAIEPWTPPDVWHGLTDSVINAILDDIADGMAGGALYSTHHNAQDRAAWRVVARHLTDDANKAEARAKAVIKEWLKTGLLLDGEFYDERQRKDAKGVRVDDQKRPPRTP